MQTIEITGKSVDEATKAAAAKLGVDAQSLKVTVLEETKGLFGKSNVRVLAEVVGGQAKATPDPKQAVQETMEPAPPAEVEQEQKKADRGGRARRGKDKVAVPVEEPASEEAQVAEELGEGSEAAAVEATEKDADQLSTLVRDMLASAGLDVNIKGTSINGRYVSIELDGKDVAHLVGKHGEVLNAMQYLVNIVAGRKYNNGIRATLDGNNYRRRREEALYQLATRVAEEVKNRGEEAVLDALPAFERRIVHKSLSDYEGVQTYSEGEEPNRRVVIAPLD